MTAKRILVLCTGNSCRSQMAEGFINYFGRNKVSCKSAGLFAKGVNPWAKRVMLEAGVDISHQTSNAIDEYLEDYFDLVVTVCYHAKESCPVYPTSTKTIHRSFRDPDGSNGTEEEILDQFRRVRDEISQFAQKLVYGLDSSI